MSKKLLLCFSCYTLLSVQLIYAAPFCVVTSYGKNCWYYDMPSCQEAAVSSRGACVINQNEVKIPSGGAPFCVVTSYGTNCWYYDAPSCQQAAASNGGTCVVKSN
jgi:hypothetical protein